MARAIPTTGHLIVPHRSLQALVEWADEFARNAAQAGRRVLWAPAHTLGGAVSLRAWILDQAVKALGESAPKETSLLLSGAADVILLIDPASADAASLQWLTQLMACAEEVSDLMPVPPMPQLVVLVPARGGAEGAAADFLARLTAMGSHEIRVESNLGPVNAGVEVQGLAARDELYGALALAPVPLTRRDLEEVAKAAGGRGLAISRIVAGPLFVPGGDYVLPAGPDVRRRLREQLEEDCMTRAATILRPIIEARYPTLPDAGVELAMRAGATRDAAGLVRAQLESHVAAGRPEEALRLLEISRSLHLPLESGPFAQETEDAKLACLLAQSGRLEQAADMIKRLSRKRPAYGEYEFIEWLALGARHLAQHMGFEPRLADSLLRRAIRLAGGDTDKIVRLKLMRVTMLSSDAMRLKDRSGWLLTHINYEMLGKVSKRTLAQYYEDTAQRLFKIQNVRGAMRRLRRLIVMDLPDRQMSRGLLLMARCRAIVADHDAALRFATTGLHHALRAADVDLVRAAARFLREAQNRRPPELPRLAPSEKFAKARERLPAVAQIQAPPLADAAQVYEILQTRFGVKRWTRRRGSRVSSHGDSGTAAVPGTVCEEVQGGWRRLVSDPGTSALRSLTLLRADGSDLVVYEAAADSGAREDALIRLLLADRETLPDAQTPARRTVIDEYYRRALETGVGKSLYGALKRVFNKDVILYFEEQGIPKDELAEKLGISRATLYRIYARSGLNI